MVARVIQEENCVFWVLDPASQAQQESLECILIVATRRCHVLKLRLLVRDGALDLNALASLMCQ